MMDDLDRLICYCPAMDVLCCVVIEDMHSGKPHNARIEINNDLEESEIDFSGIIYLGVL